MNGIFRKIAKRISTQTHLSYQDSESQQSSQDSQITKIDIIEIKKIKLEQDWETEYYILFENVKFKITPYDPYEEKYTDPKEYTVEEIKVTCGGHMLFDTDESLINHILSGVEKELNKTLGKEIYKCWLSYSNVFERAVEQSLIDLFKNTTLNTKFYDNKKRELRNINGTEIRKYINDQVNLFASYED